MLQGLRINSLTNLTLIDDWIGEPDPVSDAIATGVDALGLSGNIPRYAKTSAFHTVDGRNPFAL